MIKKPVESVPSMTFYNWPLRPKNIAPLYFLGSNFSLNFFKESKKNYMIILSQSFLLEIFFKFFVMNFAVPSAVLRATFPVKPSVLITFEIPFIISLLSM